LNAEVIFLGGVGELGANSVYIYIDGTGIIIDAGLHPRKRDKDAFPSFDAIFGKPVDLLIITHAHTDHIGAIPFLLKYFPHTKIMMTKATRDLSEIMLKDTAKLLQTELVDEYSIDTLSLYKPEVLENIWMLMDGYNYKEEISFCGYAGRSEIKITFYPAGHILGAASVKLDFCGKTLLHSGDVQFINQAIIAGADLPKHHIDSLIIESTNAGEPDLPDYNDEIKRLAKFINEIVDKNGSILIPAFALGKTQEILKILYSLMQKNSIPNLNIYTGGLGKVISRFYDKYCYSVPMVKSGFEISDIPQEDIIWDELMTGKYFKEPAIVVASSGMMNVGTTSYQLANKWIKMKNFGIAFIGYLDESSPGYEILKANLNKDFKFGTIKTRIMCKVQNFRFTSHAYLKGIINYIADIKPNIIFINHGDYNSSKNLGIKINEHGIKSQYFIPDSQKSYQIL
jgi:Cft2 family RNA processing exonuclease